MSNANYRKPAETTPPPPPPPTEEQRAFAFAVKNLLMAVENARLAHDLIQPWMKRLALVSGNGEIPSKANVIGQLAAETVEVVMGTLVGADILRAQNAAEPPKKDAPVS